ncbi:enoyl-CoA hydratase-related protein [Dermatobacter hominis]|uniref:enoyl-CoA hydratase-related protein n=1 Tax=Dermatobacter hominis TaxID=2884263 RepID=UPI001D0FF401|nr:enoyl-CoA hydratase-related protein [Dermatobacter hominis]UDY36843.1 enoyl-CoA hydratase/isomerase family protein [Dermatobacter hominis]
MSMVQVEAVDEHVRIVRLRRPERLNALSIDLAVELDERLAEVGRDNAARVVVLTGEGRAFCSGLDLKDYGVIPNIDGLSVHRIASRSMRTYSQLTRRLRAIPQPVIAAVNGPAYGGGMCLALGADLRIADEGATFNATGIVNGLTSAEMGAGWLLPRLIGAANANDIMLTGRRIDAAEALRMGLVSRVVAEDDLLDEALAMAASMVRYSHHGLEATKQSLWVELEIGSLDAAIEFEDRNQLMAGFTDNLPTAIRAFDRDDEPVYLDEPRKDLFDQPGG